MIYKTIHRLLTLVAVSGNKEGTFEQVIKQREPGQKPDVVIPLALPKKLSDNVDEWVMWVMKDMKK